MSKTNLTLEDFFDFGTYKGEQVEDVIEDHPDYIEWLISEQVCGFANDAVALIVKRGIF